MWGRRMVDARRPIALSLPCFEGDEIEGLQRVLASGWVTQGPEVAAFEREFAEAHGASYGVACTSGSTALHLILAALGVGPGDEVMVPSFTWVATVNAVLLTGAEPVLLDVDPRTFNLRADVIASRLTTRTRAIVAVHLFGLCADVQAIAAQAPGVPIVEDAACAAGGLHRGTQAGSLGVAAAFSFHPRKTLTTGEGGMVTTSDSALAERLRRLRNHGASMPSDLPSPPPPHAMPIVSELGFNYRMTDLQAALGRRQLTRLPGFIAERRRLASRYTEGLSDLPWLRLPAGQPGAPELAEHTFQSYVCIVDEAALGRSRNDLMDELAAAGIATRPGTHAVHMLAYHRERLGVAPGVLPGATICDGASMAIPMHNRLSDADQDYVIERLRAAV